MQSVPLALLSLVSGLGLLLASPPAVALGNLNFQEGVDDGFGAYSGTQDTSIDVLQPGTNFGSEALDFVDGAPDFDHLLIRFDDVVGTGSGQLALGSYVVSAELVLRTGGAPSGTTSTHQLHALLQTWDAATLTWNNGFGGDGVDADDVDASSSAITSIPPTGTNQEIRLDVLSLAEAWTAGAPNHGVALLPGGTDGLGIRLSEDPTASLRPRLEILAFPAGVAAFADEVTSYDVSMVGGGPSVDFSDPQAALGPPDSPEPAGCTLGTCPVSLGSGGSITLRFTDNVLTGSDDAGLDLWVFEVGSEIEDTFVEVSADAVTWHDVGKVFGATSGIDLDAFGFGASDVFSYVRLTDDPNEGSSSGVSVGADIDAVGTISSLPILEVDWSFTLALQAHGLLDPGLLLGLSGRLAEIQSITPTAITLRYTGLSPNVPLQLDLAGFGPPFYPPDPVHVMTDRIEVEMDQDGTMFTLAIDFESSTGDLLDPGAAVAFDPQPEPPAAGLYDFDPAFPAAAPGEGLGVFLPLTGGVGAPRSTAITLGIQILDDADVPLPLNLVAAKKLPALGPLGQAVLIGGLVLVAVRPWAWKVRPPGVKR